MISGSGISDTKFLPSDPNKLCNRLKLLLREKRAGKNSNNFNGKIIAIIDILVKYKCISKKQQMQTSVK